MADELLRPEYNPDVTVFGETNFRDQRKRFGIKDADRRGHMYIIGKTGMGKTTLMEHMLYQDIHAGEAVVLLDSDGRLTENMLHYIPEKRLRDVVYLDPRDESHPHGFNLLEGATSEEERHDLVEGLLGVLREVWKDVWGSRFEYVLKNALLSLTYFPEATLLHLLPLFTDPVFREKVIARVTDEVLVGFWRGEFEPEYERFSLTAVEPLRDKLGQLMSAPHVRNIIGQKKTGFSFQDIVEKKRIVFLRLRKDVLGSEMVSLLGTSFLLHLAHAQKKSEDIRPVYVYADEMQYLAGSVLKQLASSVDQGINLVLSHKFFSQINEEDRKSFFDTISTLVAFRTSMEDAEVLKKEFAPIATAKEIATLQKFTFMVKLLIDGEISQPFTAQGLAPLPIVGLKRKIIAFSREMYGTKKEDAEKELTTSLRIGVSKSVPRVSHKKKVTPPPKTEFQEKMQKVVHAPPPKKPVVPKEKPKQESEFVKKIQDLSPGEEAQF